jgi:hypothetical protein
LETVLPDAFLDFFFIQGWSAAVSFVSFPACLALASGCFAALTSAALE